MGAEAAAVLSKSEAFSNATTREHTKFAEERNGGVPTVREAAKGEFLNEAKEVSATGVRGSR